MKVTAETIGSQPNVLQGSSYRLLRSTVTRTKSLLMTAQTNNSLPKELANWEGQTFWREAMGSKWDLEHFRPFPGLPARSCPFGHTTLKSHRFVMTFEPGRRMRGAEADTSWSLWIVWSKETNETNKALNFGQTSGWNMF